MKRGEVAAKEGAVRKTVRFTAEAMVIIETYRRNSDPIPSFSKAVNDLLIAAKSLGEETGVHFV